MRTFFCFRFRAWEFFFSVFEILDNHNKEFIIKMLLQVQFERFAFFFASLHVESKIVRASKGKIKTLQAKFYNKKKRRQRIFFNEISISIKRNAFSHLVLVSPGSFRALYSRRLHPLVLNAFGLHPSSHTGDPVPSASLPAPPQTFSWHPSLDRCSP